MHREFYRPEAFGASDWADYAELSAELGEALAGQILALTSHYDFEGHPIVEWETALDQVFLLAHGKEDLK